MMAATFEEALTIQYDYKPTDEEVIRQLDTVTMTPHVGASAVGKNYLMTQLNKRLGYHIVGSTVSRQLREDDPDNVRHRNLSELLVDIEKGELVQFAAIEKLGSRAIYASTIEDYQLAGINIKDIFAHSVESLSNSGFRRIRPVCILTPPDEWEKRLDLRFRGMSFDDKATRLDEAEKSIKWIIEGSPNISRVMVLGSRDSIDNSIERVKEFLDNDSDVPNEQTYFDTAELMLGRLPKLRDKYLKDDE